MIQKFQNASMIRPFSQIVRKRRNSVRCWSSNDKNCRLIKVPGNDNANNNDKLWIHSRRKFSSLKPIVVSKEKNTISKRTLEEQYSRKTPLEHILLRPGMYVGPTEALPPKNSWILDVDPLSLSQVIDRRIVDVSTQQSENETNQMKEKIPLVMVQKECSMIPALQKIFDEILVNATDNHLRHPKTCTRLEVSIDPGDVTENREPMIRVWNNGNGIPIRYHEKENMYVPEMLFGHLLTGSNFDDTERRITGGRHGYGAKLSNIFSKSFTIDTIDSSRKLRYTQTWNNNMTQAGEPQITELAADENYNDHTCITFVPDMEILSGGTNARTIGDQDYSLMCRRVVDAAGCAAGKLRVLLNGNDVSMESFADYVNLYRTNANESSSRICYTNIGSRWNIGVGLSENNSFVAVSFVNGMSTSRGGTHVNAIINQVTRFIQERVTKIDPSISGVITPSLVKRNLFLACNAYIENPTFDSQMKEYLTSSPSTFGSSFTLSDKYLKELVRSAENGGPGIVESVIEIAKGRQQVNLFKEIGGKKGKRQLLSIPKLEDAHNAGTKHASNCTLILTEGDSAKALAVAGLEKIGRETFGVFPLRGKFLNVRNASVDQLSKNAEVKALISILGLDFDSEYDTKEERDSLRYGRIMLMTDQDTDGSHIKGLVINFFRHFWPKLLKPTIDEPFEQPFLSCFRTPLLKATRKTSKESLSFYSEAEYNAWRASLGDKKEHVSKWKVKYYKGLGTSTPVEAKQYFAEFDKHHVQFRWKSELDGELLDKVFDKARAADRRDWIANEYNPEATVLYDTAQSSMQLTYEDFVNKEMIHFSNSDNIRSLPNVIDGLKPSQRKVLHACFKRKLKSEIKVAQLSGYCAEHTAYHHGEVSLQSTIIGMAQDFVGSNNINLLIPSGQFGTRLAGGNDAASPRYIFTRLSPVARYLFPEDDDVLLNYLEDDGQQIEPRFFCPIIPLLLVNGAQGIGTGWSTFIPQHEPMSVLDYIRAKLDKTLTLPRIEPYVKGFKGTIEREGLGYTSYGRFEILDNKTVHIDELPVGVWTNTYKAFLLKMQADGKIVDFKEDHTTTKVSFTVKLKPSQLNRMQQSGLEVAFKLKSNLQLTNMNAFDADGTIQKFESVEAIAEAYFPRRLSLYDDRKSVIISEMSYKSKQLENKARFIQLIAEGHIDLVGGQLSEDKTISVLKTHGFNTIEELESIRKNNSIQSKKLMIKGNIGEGEEDLFTFDDDYNQKTPFDYLFKMPLSSLTSEKIAKLEKEASDTKLMLNSIRDLRSEELWLSDLEKLASHL